MGTRRHRHRAQPGPASRAATSFGAKRAIAAGAALVLVAALAAFLGWPRPPLADLGPIDGQNVLLVTIDTLRADALGSYGGPAATPALDQLASEGVRFDFAHAHAVVTLPSHASILTGEYPFQHGLRDNAGYRLPAGKPTAATLLKQAGYATAAFVAAYPLHSRFGLNAGFDLYHDRFGEGMGSAELVTPEGPASAIVPLAREWIAARAAVAGHLAPAEGRQPAAQPWFVWVHLFDPHAPYQPPPPFDTQYAAQPYYGEVAATDAALAPLFDDVRRAARPTLVIVTSDHGEALGDHGEETHGIFAYEATLRVPLVIAELGGEARASAASASGRSRGGEVSSVSARHIDILPTILDAVGQPVPTGLQGRTLLPRKEREEGAPPRLVYFEAMTAMLGHGWAPLTGVLMGREKYISLPVAERYDLPNDPGEQVNLAGRAPDRDRTLAAALRGFAPVLPGGRMTEAPDAIARLRALGYVSTTVPVKAAYTEADDPKRLVELDAAVHGGLSALEAGRADEAASAFRQVIARRRGMTMAYRYLALTEWRQGNAAGAVDVLRQAMADGVTDARAAAQLGEYLTDAGRTAEAIRLLEPLAASPAADPDVFNVLGIAYARAGQVPAAQRAFERMLESLPASSAPLENLGMLALQQRDVDRAQRYFDRAIAIAPDSSRAHAGVGATAFERGDRRAAYEAWRRAVDLDPTNYDTLFDLAVNLARDGRVAEARPYLEQFQRTAPPAFYADRLQAVARLLRSGS